MKKLIVITSILLGFTSVYSQNTTAAKAEDKIYTSVQQKPVFNGDLDSYLAHKLIYPEEAKKNNIQGTVWITFVVEKDGSVSNVKVQKPDEGYHGLEKAALVAVWHMPKWTPGTQDGKPVRVQYILPVKFVLDDKNNNSGAQQN